MVKHKKKRRETLISRRFSFLQIFFKLLNINRDCDIIY